MKILPLLITSVMALSSVAYADKAVANLVRRAQQRDVSAMRTLGIRMYKGGSPGIPTDRKVALTWLNMAADQKDEAALCFLGDIYAKGFHVSKNEKKAAEYYMEAARLGNSKAAEALDKIPVKYAEEWHVRNAEKGNFSSAMKLGMYYSDGEETPKDTERAQRFFKRAIRANRDKAVSKMEKKDMADAVEFWTVLADDFDDVGAALRLADAYNSGIGVSVDKKKSLRYYMIADDAGDETAREMLKSFPLEDTLEWWEKHARNGDADAALRLGKAYSTGQDGLRQSPDQALRYLRMAAERGNDEAGSLLKEMETTSVPQTPRDAFDAGNVDDDFENDEEDED